MVEEEDRGYHNSPGWDLNPEPFDPKSNALPLSYLEVSSFDTDITRY